VTIGLDLGTTNSCAAIFRNGKVEVVKDFVNSARTIPSILAFKGSTAEEVVGHAAVPIRRQFPESAIFGKAIYNNIVLL